MDKLFFQCVKFSLIASVIVIGILVFRLIVKKTPKWIDCALWALVAIRLIVPFSFESKMSIIPNENIVSNNFTRISFVFTGSAEKSMPSAIAIIWVIGIAIMIAYGIGSSLYLKHVLSTATLFETGVKQSDKIESSFVFGLIKPIIYVPYNLSEGDIKQVLAHEKAHITRRDYLWKIAGFLILSVYWFNPFMWVAFLLLGRDMESACDEKVIKGLNVEDRKSYSYALLECSVKKGIVYSCPVAFGEINVKARINNVMNYKKPKLTTILAATAFCAIAGGVAMTNQPKAEAAVLETTEEVSTEETMLCDDCIAKIKVDESMICDDCIVKIKVDESMMCDECKEKQDINSGETLILKLYTTGEADISEIESGLEESIVKFVKEHTEMNYNIKSVEFVGEEKLKNSQSTISRIDVDIDSETNDAIVTVTID